MCRCIVAACVTYFDLTDSKMKGLKLGARVEYEPKPEPTELCHCPLVSVELPSAVLLRVEGMLGNGATS